MSNHLFRLLDRVMRVLYRVRPSPSKEESTKNSLVLLAAVGIHAVYVFFTRKTQEIRIVKKYMITQYGFTNYMIVDSVGRHYNMINSPWYWKWDSIEDWTQIQEGETRLVRMYGRRWPVIGLFPNIVGIEGDKTL